MSWIFHLLIDAVILFLAARFMPGVTVKNFVTALIVAVVVSVLGFLTGWLLKTVLNIATLGIFYFTGLTFVINIVASAIVIEITDQLTKDFDTKGFMPSLYLAILFALGGALVNYMFF